MTCALLYNIIRKDVIRLSLTLVDKLTLEYDYGKQQLLDLARKKEYGYHANYELKKAREIHGPDYVPKKRTSALVKKAHALDVERYTLLRGIQMTCEHLIKCGVNPDWIEDHIGQVDRALEGRVGDGVPFLIENKRINLEDLKIDIDTW